MNAVAKVNGDISKIGEPQESAALEPVAAPEPASPARGRRRGGRFVLMLAVPLALAVGGGYVWITGGRYQETENANLRQARVAIAADAAGRIVKVNLSDNQPVKQGDALFLVDPEPYRIALAQAESALAAARLSVEQLRAAYSQALAQERAARSELDYLEAQLSRQSELAKKGIAAKSALDEAQRDLAKARDEHTAAVEGITSARAALGGDPDIATDKHPSVLSALAARDKAAYDLERTTVFAPADGIVSQASSFKVGQFVGAGTPLFSLVETHDTWIEANFKETQLTHMKPGQMAEVVLDTYPDRVFHATVEAIGAGTGAEFSLLPAQNATGNWVKVTQRIPVRLKLDDDEAQVALRTGMSATVSVDTETTHDWASLFGAANAAE